MKHTTNNINTILFDLAGTLVDTELVAVQVVKEYFAQWQITLSPKVSQMMSGKTWQSGFEILLKEYPFTHS